MQITDKDIQKFRERAKTELQSNGAVGRLAWDAVVNALCTEVEGLRKNAAPGNAAAMRSALESIEDDCRILDRKDMWEEEGECYYDALRDIREKVSAAIAAPARNCDRYATYAEAVEAYREWTRRTTGDVSNVSGRGMLGWLFAPAEGGAE